MATKQRCATRFGSCRPRGADREAWMLMLELVRTSRSALISSLGELGLSPVQAQALRLLAPGAAVPMRDLATALACDASNVTGIVDRLESRGIVERRSAPHDRRVKVLVLTPAGSDLRRRVLARLYDAPPAIRALPVEEQQLLRDVLSRALAYANSAE